MNMSCTSHCHWASTQTVPMNLSLPLHHLVQAGDAVEAVVPVAGDLRQLLLHLSLQSTLALGAV